MLQVMTSVEQRTSSVALPPKKRYLLQHIKDEEKEKQTLLKRGVKRVKRDWSQPGTNEREKNRSNFKRESVRLTVPLNMVKKN